MGPSKERSAGQRTYLSLMLTGAFYLASTLKIIAKAAANVQGS